MLDKDTTDVGIGLRHRHFQDILELKPKLPLLEVHTENFFAKGGIAAARLEEIRKNYPLSAHGVGLSLGSADLLSKEHLNNIKEFINRFDPTFVSEHLSWGAAGGVHLNDLLPMPYTEESLDVICRNIDMAQMFLRRQILIENPSAYIQFKSSTIPEPEFLQAIAQRTGCGILLDVNNIYVTAKNHGLDASYYIDNISAKYVHEIHLAGYAEVDIEGKKLLIDDHGKRVFPDVWKLYGEAIEKFGRIPTIIEWDTDVPELNVLIEEAQKAQQVIDKILNGEQKKVANAF